MSNCVIRKNPSTGMVTRVSSPSGDRSVLFDRIAGIAPLMDRNKALKAYMTIYGKPFMDRFGDWRKASPVNKAAVASMSRELSRKGVDANIIKDVVSSISGMTDPVLVTSRTTSLLDGMPVFTKDIMDVSDPASMYVMDMGSSSVIDVDALSIPYGEDRDQSVRDLILGEKGGLVYIKSVEYGGMILSREVSPSPITSITPSSVPSSRLMYDNGEPRAFFMSPDGSVYDSFGDAMMSLSSSRGDITMGFISGTVEDMGDPSNEPSGSSDLTIAGSSYTLNNKEAFIPVMAIGTSTDMGTIPGLINHLIRKRLVSGDKKRIGDKYYLTGYGNVDGLKVFNAIRSLYAIRNIFGERSANINSLGGIEIDDTVMSTDIKLVSRDGKKVSTMDREKVVSMIRQGRYGELADRYRNMDTLAASVIMEDGLAYGHEIVSVAQSEREADVQNRTDVMNILSTLGVRIMGMSDYLEKYPMRHNGVEPSARALSDMANKVIALAEGATVSDLNEEVSHFLIDTYKNQGEIDDILDDVVDTWWWDNYAPSYYEVYGKEYEGEELDSMVKREILGKIMADKFGDRGLADPNEDAYVSLWDRIINAIREFFSDQRTRMDDVLDRIRKSALADDPSAFDTSLLKDSDHLMYSLTDKDMANRLLKDKRILERQYRNLQRIRSSQRYGIQTNIADLDRIQESMSEVGRSLDHNSVVQSTRAIVATAMAQANYVSNVARAMMSRQGDGAVKIDPETEQTTVSFFSQMLPMVKGLRGFVNSQSDDYYDQSTKRDLVGEMDNIISIAESADSDIKALRSADRASIVRNVLEKTNIPMEHRERIIAAIEEVKKDITKMTRWFGTLEHSKNEVLGMLGKRLSAAHYDAREEAMAVMDPLMDRIRKSGWNMADNDKLLKKDEDGTASEYIQSGIDMPRYNRMLTDRQAGVIIDIYGLDKKDGAPSRKDIIAAMSSSRGYEAVVGTETDRYDNDGNPVIKESRVRIKTDPDHINISYMSLADQRKFNDGMREWYSSNTEMPMTPEHYERMDRIYAKVDEALGRPMRDETKALLSRIRNDLFVKRSRFIGANGKVDYRKFMSDPIAWRDYLDTMNQKRIAKSVMYTDGSDKDGVDLMISKDIEAWDNVWKKEREREGDTREVSDEFTTALSTVETEEGREAAMEFLLAEGRLAFSKDSWGTSSDKGYYEDLADKIIDEIGDRSSDEALEILDSEYSIDRLSKEIDALLNPYRDSTRYGEFDFDRMSKAGVVAKVKGLYDELSAYKYELRKSAEDYGVDTDMPGDMETGVTETYIAALKDSGMDELDFVKNHIPQRMVKHVMALSRTLSKRSLNMNMNKRMKRFLSDMTGIPMASGRVDFSKAVIAKMNDDPGLEERLVIEYGKTMMYPYMRRYSPKGFEIFKSRLRKGDYSVSGLYSDMVSGMTKDDSLRKYGFDINMIDLRVDNQWMEEAAGDRSMRNPNYDPSLGYGSRQPRKDIYRDNDYYDKYGIVEEDVTQPDGTVRKTERATANTDMWEVRNMMLDISRKAMTDYGEGTYRNIYLIPQVSKRSVERLYQAGSDPRASLENTFRDIFTNRVDDPMYGTQRDLDMVDDGDEAFRVIPKYYLRRLEDKKMVSHDLPFSFSMMALQSATYKHKKEAMGDVMGLRNVMLSTEFDGGKSPDSSNSYEMFKDWMNALIYDVRISNKRVEADIAGFKIDLSKVAEMWTRFVSVTNLGFSPFVAMTGAITGQANFLLEGIVGQYISKGSMAYAYGEASRHMGSYLSEIGDVRRTNKVYVVGEKMGLFSIRNRIGSASYNKAWRTIGRDMPYKMLEVLNSPLDPQVMIAVMDDTRLYNGRFYTYQRFKEAMMSSGRMDYDTVWEGMRGDSMWSMIDVVDGKIVAKEASNQALVDSTMSSVSQRARSLSQICDGALNEENRVGASRNVLANMLLPHRGWLIIAMQRAWKKEGYNFQTEQFEKGYNWSLIHMINRAYRGVREGRMTELHKVLSEEYHKMAPHEQMNIKRAIVYNSMFLIFAMIGRALMGYRDEDQDSWFAQFGSYIGFRFINEMVSQTSPLMEVNAIDMIQDPLVTARKFGDLMNPYNWNPTSEVRTGVYKGESKLWRQLMKFSFGKQWYNVKTARDIRQTSDYWLLTNKATVGFFLGASEKGPDGEEEPNWFF